MWRSIDVSQTRITCAQVENHVLIYLADYMNSITMAVYMP